LFARLLWRCQFGRRRRRRSNSASVTFHSISRWRLPQFCLTADQSDACNFDPPIPANGHVMKLVISWNCYNKYSKPFFSLVGVVGAGTGLANRKICNTNPRAWCNDTATTGHFLQRRLYTKKKCNSKYPKRKYADI